MVLSSSARPVRTAACALAELSGLVHDGIGALAVSVLSRVQLAGRGAGPALSPEQHDAVGAAGVAMQQALAAAAETLTIVVESAADDLGALLGPAAGHLGVDDRGVLAHPTADAASPARRTGDAGRSSAGRPGGRPAGRPGAERVPGAAPAPPDGGPRLPAAQRRALRHYTTIEGVDEMNAYLRRPAEVPVRRRPALRQLVDDAVAGLAELPRYTGVAYRGTSLPAQQLPRWRPGVVVADRGFASASANVSVAEAFRAGGNAFITIVGRSGADIRALSSYAHEAEVLFPPGTRFRIAARSWDDQRECWSFLIEEVDPCASTARLTTR